MLKKLILITASLLIASQNAFADVITISKPNQCPSVVSLKKLTSFKQKLYTTTGTTYTIVSDGSNYDTDTQWMLGVSTNINTHTPININNAISKTQQALSTITQLNLGLLYFANQDRWSCNYKITINGINYMVVAITTEAATINSAQSSPNADQSQNLPNTGSTPSLMKLNTILKLYN